MTSGPPNAEKPALVDQNAAPDSRLRLTRAPNVEKSPCVDQDTAARFEASAEQGPHRGKIAFC
jgi:hypothetical protein